jgi:hypothetical protein
MPVSFIRAVVLTGIFDTLLPFAATLGLPPCPKTKEEEVTRPKRGTKQNRANNDIIFIMNLDWNAPLKGIFRSKE